MRNRSGTAVFSVISMTQAFGTEGAHLLHERADVSDESGFTAPECLLHGRNITIISAGRELLSKKFRMMFVVNAAEYRCIILRGGVGT